MYLVRHIFVVATFLSPSSFLNVKKESLIKSKEMLFCYNFVFMFIYIFYIIYYSKKTASSYYAQKLINFCWTLK